MVRGPLSSRSYGAQPAAPALRRRTTSTAPAAISAADIVAIRPIGASEPVFARSPPPVEPPAAAAEPDGAGEEVEPDGDALDEAEADVLAEADAEVEAEADAEVEAEADVETEVDGEAVVVFVGLGVTVDGQVCDS